MKVLPLAYVPLTDAAPLIVADALGFAREEGLSLDLFRAASWAQARDMLMTGQVAAAHMLLPVPVAQAMGLGPAGPRLDVLMILSQGGQAIAVSSALWVALRNAGHGFDPTDARAAGAALVQVAGNLLRVGVPHPFSTHAELVRHWLTAAGLGADRFTIMTHPPQMMAAALASGEVDLACVGEPWASVAVERGAAAILLTGRAIWAAAPEKALVATHAMAEDPAIGRLMRAVWRAGRWLDRPDNRVTAAELMAAAGILDLPAEVVERGLAGRLIISPAGEVRQVPGFVTFHDGAATFPWKSLATLFAERIAGRNAGATGDVAAVFRTDLYRAHLRSAGADLPGASSKIEGAMTVPHAVASEQGQMILAADAFFDGAVHDPGFSPR
jgi:NitT/TauT family transport system ATP-binding protein